MGKKYTVEKPNKKETAFYDDPISEAELMEMKSEGNKIDGKALYANDKF